MEGVSGKQASSDTRALNNQCERAGIKAGGARGGRAGLSRNGRASHSSSIQ